MWRSYGAASLAHVVVSAQRFALGRGVEDQRLQVKRGQPRVAIVAAGPLPDGGGLDLDCGVGRGDGPRLFKLQDQVRDLGHQVVFEHAPRLKIRSVAFELGMVGLARSVGRSRIAAVRTRCVSETVVICSYSLIVCFCWFVLGCCCFRLSVVRGRFSSQESRRVDLLEPGHDDGAFGQGVADSAAERVHEVIFGMSLPRATWISARGQCGEM